MNRLEKDRGISLCDKNNVFVCEYDRGKVAVLGEFLLLLIFGFSLYCFAFLNQWMPEPPPLFVGFLHQVSGL